MSGAITQRRVTNEVGMILRQLLQVLEPRRRVRRARGFDLAGMPFGHAARVQRQPAFDGRRLARRESGIQVAQDLESLALAAPMTSGIRRAAAGRATLPWNRAGGPRPRIRG